MLCTATGLLFVSLQTRRCGGSCLSRLASLTAVPVLLQICGEANVGVIREAAKAGVPRCAFISVHDYNFPGTGNQHHRRVHPGNWSSWRFSFSVGASVAVHGYHHLAVVCKLEGLVLKALAVSLLTRKSAC